MPNRTRQTAPVSARALIQRINRKLLADNDGDPRADRVRKSRGARALQDLGEYYVLDVGRNAIVSTDIDLEELGREKGVLAEWESLVADE